MNLKMYVLMVVPSNFPNGDAGAVRDMAFACIYQELGYEIVLIGAGRESIEGEYNRVHYYSIFQKANGIFGHIKRFVFAKTKYMMYINKTIKERGLPSIIHINHISHGVINNLRILAQETGIQIIHDSTEWYSPCEFAWGRWDKQYILKDWLNKKIIQEPIKVIGISSYLTDYFFCKGLKAIRIPVIMDVLNTPISVNTEEKIKFIYAGNPASKDYIKEIVLGIISLSEEQQEKIEFHFLGVTCDQLKLLINSDKLPLCINAYGRVPREKVEEIMLQMDFSVLLRPSEERYAKAGFPTKSVEAMSHGVAMVCNLSSDLEMYLKNEKNSILISGYTSYDFNLAINYILGLNRKQINLIKRNARILAEQNFDYRLWKNTLNNLINA